jgi:hypothetical protein
LNIIVENGIEIVIAKDQEDSDEDDQLKEGEESKLKDDN